MKSLWAQHNRAPDGAICVGAEFLEVVAGRG
jgi:hypothetical protein